MNVRYGRPVGVALVSACALGVLSNLVWSESSQALPTQAAPTPRIDYERARDHGFGLNGVDRAGVSFSITFASTNYLDLRIDDHVYLAGKKLPEGLRLQSAFTYRDAQGKESATATDFLVIAYEIRNEGNKSFQTEARLVVDTMIDRADQHPFLVPGPLGRITTSADLRLPLTLPPYFRAVSNAENPKGVYFVLQGLGLESPSRCLLTDLNSPDETWDHEVTDFDDSSFVLYWPRREISPKGKRVLGFGCSLRSVPSGE